MTNSTVTRSYFEWIKANWTCIGWSWSGEPLMWENPLCSDEYFNIEDWIIDEDQ